MSKSEPPYRLPLAKFATGQLFITLSVLDDVTFVDAMSALERHIAGDWGEVSDADRQANEDALRGGHRLLSAYRAANGTKFYIITEADRSLTTILLPEEY